MKQNDRKRGSKKEKQLVECSLKSDKAEDLIFGVSNIPFKAVYVKENDFVKKGDLIAELKLSDLDEKIQDLEMSKKLKKSEIAHTNQLITYEKQKAILVSDEDERKAIQEGIDDYQSALEMLKKELSNMESQMKVVKQDMAKRSVYAPIDGYVRDIIPLTYDSLSNEKRVFAKVYSPNFRFESINPVSHELKVGQKVRFTIDEKTYDAEIIGTKSEMKGTKVYLKTLTDKVFQVGTIGSFTLVGQSFDDSLYVNEKAVIEVDGKPAVIGLDEFGFKNFVPIETGLHFNGVIQIISGVKEGDQVVLE